MTNKTAKPNSDCQICRLNYWLQKGISQKEAFELANKKRLKLKSKK